MKRSKSTDDEVQNGVDAYYDTTAVTVKIIMDQIIAIGYDPTIRKPSGFIELYEDLCSFVGFRDWVNSVSEPKITAPPRSQEWYNQIYDVHRWMGEYPMWSRRFHILLSVIESGTWSEYVAKNTKVVAM